MEVSIHQQPSSNFVRKMGFYTSILSLIYPNKMK
jgi:hypothetical protein